MTSPAHKSNSVILSPPNHKTFWNLKQEVAWRLQPITLSEAGPGSGLLLHMLHSQPQTSFFFMCETLFFWTTPEFRGSFSMNDFILSSNILKKLSKRHLFLFFFSDSKHWWFQTPTRSSCQLYCWRIGWKVNSQDVSCAPNKSTSLLYHFGQALFTSSYFLTLSFLLRWLVASCSLSWTLIWVLINSLSPPFFMTSQFLVVHTHHHALSDASTSDLGS